MTGRAGKGGPPADLMVCFPARAHLRLMAPKPICSPSRPNADVHRPPARASPLFKVRNRGREVPSSSEVSEPTSPKVTCAGQIKVRGHGRRSTVREGVKRRRPHWLQALGFRKDVMHLITAIRGLRFKVGCFGPFHGSSVDCTSEEEEEEKDEKERRNAFSKWLMGLDQENQRKEEEEKSKAAVAAFAANDDDGCVDSGDDHSVPPPNALLLMRCRSAPASGLARRAEQEEENQGSANEDKKKKKKQMMMTKVEEEELEMERMVVPTSYAPDFLKLSSDIVKETWVVGSTVDPLLRSRSWKR